MDGRIDRLLGALPEEIDGALITSDVNRRYFTGFPSSAGTLLATRNGSWLIIDGRYFEAAQEGAAGCGVVLQQRLFRQLEELCGKAGVKSLAVEEEAVCLRQFARLEEELWDLSLRGDAGLSREIMRLRAVKSERELGAIRAAQKLTDEAFAQIVREIRIGLTEREIALRLEFYMRERGAQGVAFEFIVASGRHSSVPHAVPDDKPVERGDFITMDFGVVVDGYCSDMTRTVAVGEVSGKQREVYDTVLRAQLAALGAVKAGVVCSSVDRAARELIDASPYKGLFTHSTGHALGLEVHEAPTFSEQCETVLEPGMVLSVEPGIYLPGEFGVRTEDIVVVTPDGCENLTGSPKELIVCGSAQQ